LPFGSLKAGEIGRQLGVFQHVLDDEELDDGGFLAARAGMADANDLGVCDS
jgi:hypothetical protein